jgi:membrane associated rhomboid family serine protease
MPAPVKYLLIANVAIFLIDYLTRGAFLHYPLALDPAEVVGRFQIWRLVTYMFVHDISPPFLHMLFNMLMLWMFGAPVAGVLGDRKFLWMYLSAGVFAGLCSMVFYSIIGGHALIVGASGGLFALMVAFAKFFPTQQFLMFFIFPVQARYAVLIIGAIELLLITSNDRVAHVAHLGGALFAWIFLRLDERGFNPVESLKSAKSAHEARKIEKAKEVTQEAMIEIDPILKKIKEEGMSALTDEEKNRLERASALKRQHKDQAKGKIIDIDEYRRSRE